MGKLNIAHHKSYYPYRRDNIERVRRDEEEARLKEAAQEGKMMLADAEARIELLRQKAGLSKAVNHQRDDAVDDQEPRAGPSSLTSGGHINLFEDFEQQNMAIMVKTTQKGKSAPVTAEQGIPLAPSEKDRKPWYSDRDPERSRELDEDKKLRDLARKSVHDPLTSINQRLAQGSSPPKSRPPPPPPPSARSAPNSKVAERLSRESSERQRALALIARKKREMESATPSTVRGPDGMDGGYGDVYNRREVEEAHRHRDRRDDRRDRRGSGRDEWDRGRRW